MKPEVKQQWIKALRSRKYRKGNSIWLHTKQNHSSRFSALGVLTDLWVKEKEHQWSYVLDKHYDEEDIPVYVGLSSSKQIAVDNEVRGKLSPLVMRCCDFYICYNCLKSTLETGFSGAACCGCLNNSAINDCR